MKLWKLLNLAFKQNLGNCPIQRKNLVKRKKISTERNLINEALNELIYHEGI